ncbi:MAG: WG repeat-containing protein [Clostridia bacterium]|nr:WG repeat-containing protein [Clostridia bacterium]
MKKSKIIIITIITILVFVAIAMYLWKRNENSYKIEKVTNIKYNLILENKKYGVIDEIGNIIVKPQYDIIQIPNPSKPVFICMHDYNVNLQQYEIDVFNENGQKILTEYESVQALPTESTWDGIPFEKSVLKYKKNNKYGLISLENKIITKPIYDSIKAINYKEGMLLVEENAKYGAINIKGKVIIKPEYDQITVDNYYNSETMYKASGFIVKKKVEDSYKYGYINSNGKVLLDTQYTEISRINEIIDDKNIFLLVFKNGQAGIVKNNKTILNYEYEDISYNAYNNMFVIQRNAKSGIADIKGKIIIQPEYDSIMFGGIYINAVKNNEITILDLQGNKIENNNIYAKLPTSNNNYYITIDKDEIYRVVDREDNVKIDNNYTYIEHIKDEYFIVYKDGKNGIIDLSGKSIADLKYNSIFKIAGTEIIQANINNTNNITLLNNEMKIVCNMNNASIEKEDNYFKVFSNDDIKYFDNNGNEISYKQIEPNNKMYAKKINGKWGFVNEENKLIINNEYDMVTEFNKYGFAGIKKGGKWGVVNIKGEIIQEPIYSFKWENPSFIGKYYKTKEWEQEYYTGELPE